MPAAGDDDSLKPVADNIANHERQDALLSSESEENLPLIKEENFVCDQQTQTEREPGGVESETGKPKSGSGKKQNSETGKPDSDPWKPEDPPSGQPMSRPENPDSKPDKSELGKKVGKYAAGFGLGTLVIGGAAFVAANLIVPGLGFAAGGIVAGSTAAGMMSSAAIANGGAIAAGSSVAILQSIGATGVAATTCLGIGAGAAAAGTAAVGAVDAALGVARQVKSKKNENPREKGTQTDEQGENY